MGAGLQTQERYAAASLFTLALHSTQVDSGLATSVQGLREELRAWGQPPEEDELHLADCCTEERRALNDAAWKAFWGWDCCGPDGLLERVYRNLAIPARAWPGLKQLPETGGLSVDSQQHYVSLVRSHMSVLDPELAHGPLSSRNNSRQGSSASLAGAGGSSGDMSAGGPQPASRLGSSLGRDRASNSTGNMMTGDATSGSRSSGSLTGICSTADGDHDPFATRGNLPPTGNGNSDAGASPDGTAQHAATASSAAGHAAAPSAGQSAALQVTDGQHGSAAEAGLQAAGHRPSGCLSDDSDVEEDRQRLAAEQQTQRVLSPAGQAQHSATAAQPDAAAAVAASPSNGSITTAAVDRSGGSEAGGGVGEVAAGGPAAGGSRPQQGGAGHFEVAAPLPSDAEPAQHPLQQAFRAAQAQLAPPRREGPAPTVVEAVWELLDACVAGPRLDSSPEGSARRKRAAQKFSNWRPAARWYDARARVALKRVAGWLGVPWSKAITFETLLAHQAAAAESREAPTAGRSLASWAKIGAASVGAGALFAVTGGLAAPAIAAGLGSAITVGGSTLGIAGASAAGGTVASVFGTSAGAAVLGGSIGIAGGNFAGSRTARRIANLKEFGFWSLPSEPGQRRQSAVSAPGTSAAASPESDASAAATDSSRRSANGRSCSGEADTAAASSLAAPNRPPDAARGSGAADAWPQRLSRRQSSGSGGQAATPAAVLLPQDLGVTEDPFPASPLAREPHAGSGALLDRLSSWTPMNSHSRHNSTAAADSAAARPGSGSAQPSFEAVTLQHMSRDPLAALSADSENPPQAQNGVSESCSQIVPDPAAAQAGIIAAASAAAASIVSAGGSAEAAQPSLMDVDLQPSTGYPTTETSGHFVSPAAVPPAADAADVPEQLAPHQQPPAAQQPAGGEEASRERKWWQLARGRSGDLGPRPLLPAPFDPARARDDNLQLSISICISGWIAAKSDFMTMWEDVQLPDSERYTLVWESQELLELNAAVVDYLKATAAFEVGKLAVQKFLFTGLVAAVALPLALLSAASLLDNPWAVATERAMKAGRLLAHVLMQGAHGDRPVTLIGHSMGARVIFHCLLELCRHNCKGVVENAVLLGAPVSIRVERWRMATSSVAGRFINGYSRRDWVLGLVYRGSNGFIKGAGGISPVDCPGVENVNLSNLISGHFDYATKIDEIVDLLQL